MALRVSAANKIAACVCRYASVSQLHMPSKKKFTPSYFFSYDHVEFPFLLSVINHEIDNVLLIPMYRELH